MSLRFLTFTFWNYYILKLLRLETITFSDATLSDINIVLCYVFVPCLFPIPLQGHIQGADDKLGQPLRTHLKQ
jgi:hypothetical protein